MHIHNHQNIVRRILMHYIGSMYGIYANIWGILMVNVTIYSIHGSYGLWIKNDSEHFTNPSGVLNVPGLDPPDERIE